MNTKIQELNELIAEMSSASGGANTGHVGGVPLGSKKTMKSFNKKQEKDQRLKGKALAEDEELNEDEEIEEKLREHIRSRLKMLAQQQAKKQFLQEQALRAAIRGILKEAEESNPHPSTGINKLRDAFKKAKPTLRRFYKQLTTSDEQRQSFSAHILQAFNRMFSEVDAMSAIKGAEPSKDDLQAPPADPLSAPQPEKDIDVDIDTDQTPEKDLNLFELNNANIILEVEGENENPEQKSMNDKEAERQEFGSGLEGADKTGRNQALDAMKLIRSYFTEPYGDLENEEDKKLFRDWALYNIDLLFKSYEEELKATVDKPEINVG